MDVERRLRRRLHERSERHQPDRLSLTNAGGATSTFVGPSSCTTSGGTGSCAVTISSPTLGTTTVHASASTTVGGVALLRATGDSHAGRRRRRGAGLGRHHAPGDHDRPHPGDAGRDRLVRGRGRTPSASAADPSPGTGVAGTRCVLDPSSEPASFDDLPAGPCPYLAPGEYVISDGIHTLWAGSKDGAGNTDLTSSTFQIDRTPPLAQVSPPAMFQGAATFPVSWSGSDSASGVKNYDIRYRQAASQRDVRQLHDLADAHDVDVRARSPRRPGRRPASPPGTPTTPPGPASGRPSRAPPSRSTTRRSPAPAPGRPSTARATTARASAARPPTTTSCR